MGQHSGVVRNLNRQPPDRTPEGPLLFLLERSLAGANFLLYNTREDDS